MAKLNLTASPTFTAKVMIPVPGAKPSPVMFTFKSRTKDQFKAFLENMADREDVDAIMEVTSGWDLDDAFGKDNIEELTQNYIGSARAILETYINEQAAARLGN